MTSMHYGCIVINSPEVASSLGYAITWLERLGVGGLIDRLTQLASPTERKIRDA